MSSAFFVLPNLVARPATSPPFFSSSFRIGALKRISSTWVVFSARSAFFSSVWWKLKARLGLASSILGSFCAATSSTSLAGRFVLVMVASFLVSNQLGLSSFCFSAFVPFSSFLEEVTDAVVGWASCQVTDPSGLITFSHRMIPVPRTSLLRGMPVKTNPPPRPIAKAG